MDITGYFNARQEGDTNAPSMFAGVTGTTSEEVFTDIKAFLAAANRDYGILRVQSQVLDPFGGTDETGEIVPAIREVENQYHLTRTSDGRVVSPKTVSDQYHPMTLMDLAEEIQGWVDDEWCTPDAVFAGKNESLEIFSLRLDGGGELENGEQWTHQIVFRLPHGVGGKCRGSIISFREQCSNTFGAMAFGKEFVIGHRMSAKMTEDERAAAMAKRAKDAATAFKVAQKHIEELEKRIALWESTPITFAQAEALTDSLLDITNIDDPKLSTRKKNRREAILEGFNMPRWGTMGDTLYDWFNGVTFENSSPNSEAVKKSTVETTDRMIRNVDPNGSGNKHEAKAVRMAHAFIANRWGRVDKPAPGR
jgi:hypothetical protein